MRKKLRITCAQFTAAAILLGALSPLCACATSVDQDTPTEPTVEATLPVETTAPTQPEETILPTEMATLPVETEATEPAETVEVIVPPLEEAPEIPAHSIQVPLFYQTDYPDVLYSHGTIKTDGCSITCLAMVATYMTGHPYLPDELAGYFGGYLEGVITNIERLEAASNLLHLSWRRAANYHDALKAAKEGKVVIAMMNQESIFTDSSHFIVWAGMTDTGKILVNDPYQPNYSAWNLKNAFLYGFDPSDLCGGFSGAWIYDKSAMPEKPFIYTEEKVEVECRYPDVELTSEEKNLLARMVWVEARGETDKGQQAVAEVVLNRLVAEGFSDNIRDIIYSHNQFKSTQWLDEAEVTQTQYEAVQAALNGPYVLPIDVIHFATYPVTDRVWGTIGGHIFCYPPSNSK